MSNHNIEQMEREELVKWCKSRNIDHYKSPIDRQIKWCIEKVHEYLQEHPEDILHIRRLHYWLGSRKPMYPCQIINKVHGRIAEIVDNEGNGWRKYQLLNTFNGQLISRLTKARYRKLIDWKLITDNRNPEITHNWEQYDMEINTDYQICDDFNPNVRDMPSKFDLKLKRYKIPNNPLRILYIHYNHTDKEIEDFDYLEYIKNFSPEIDIIEGANNLNMYYIVYIIEKTTLENQFNKLCKKYAIDFFPCIGFASTTRIFEICEKAERIGKPLLILYLADKDPSGEAMPESMDVNINRAYPHPHNKVIRIGLNEDQVIKYNLPSETIKKGTKTELDALDSNIMIQIVEDAFIKCTKYAYKSREARNNRIKNYMKKRMEDMDLIVEDNEFEEYQEDMENWIKEYNKLKQKEKKFRELFDKYVWYPVKKKIQDIVNNYNKFLDSFNELELKNPDKDKLETLQKDIENKFSELFDNHIKKFHIEKLT